MDEERFFSRHRVGVCGSTMGLSRQARLFCEAVGVRLAEDPCVVIVSPGAHHRDDANEQDFAADWYIVNAAEKKLRQLLPEDDDVIRDRIETVISHDPGGIKLFQAGHICHAHGKTHAARRFSFVKSIDALIAVSGRRGTAEELALAHELNKRVLPVPSFGGTARSFWSAYRAELIRQLRIDKKRAQDWEIQPDENTTQQELRGLACEMMDTLLGSLPRRCFVIMPFAEDFFALYDFVIALAVKDAGDQPIRLDRAALPGDVSKQINEGIRACDYTVAVLDDFHHNVLYELGLAHGLGKPAILLYRKGALESKTPIPFDLTMQQRLEYQTIDAQLRDRLRNVIAGLPTHCGKVASAGTVWSASQSGG